MSCIERDNRCHDISGRVDAIGNHGKAAGQKAYDDLEHREEGISADADPGGPNDQLLPVFHIILVMRGIFRLQGLPCNRFPLP